LHEQQLPEASDYARNRIEGTEKCSNNRLNITNAFWAGMLYSILVVPSAEIMEEVYRRSLQSYIFFERSI